MPVAGLVIAGVSPSGLASAPRSRLRSSVTVFRVIAMPVIRLAIRYATARAIASSTTSVRATHKNAPHSPPGAPAAYSPYA